MNWLKKNYRYIYYVIFLFCLGAIFSWVIWGCGCPKISRPNLVNYDVKKSECQWTPRGSCVILNGNVVDDSFYDIVDAKITMTVECLDKYFPKYKAGKQEKKCFVIYLPPDWRWSCEEPQQQIFGELRSEACVLKGFKPREGCVCGSRVAIMNGNIIVVPPSLDFLRMGVVEYCTGWSQDLLWVNEEMVKCGGF